MRDATIAADGVIVTAGAWAPSLLSPLGITLPIEPQRGQIVHLRLPGQDTRDWPVVLPPGSHYLLAFDDSRVVVGATRETARVSTIASPRAVRRRCWRTHCAWRRGWRRRASSRLVWGSVRSGQVSGLCSARWTGLDGLLIGNGLGAAGLTIGPFAGRLLAYAALGRDMAFDLAAFDPMRTTSADQRTPPLR